MAKRKAKTEIQGESKPVSSFTKGEIEAALDITHSEYFMQVIALLSHDSDIKDLTFVKVPVVTPDGGTYLVSIMHVDGPKIDLHALGKAAEAKEAADLMASKAT